MYVEMVHVALSPGLWCRGWLTTRLFLREGMVAYRVDMGWGSDVDDVVARVHGIRKIETLGR